MNKAFLFGLLMLILVAGLVYAVPGQPHQFHGTVTVNGAPAPDGSTVTATVDGVTREEEVTTNGKYGYDPFFYVEDPNNVYWEYHPEIKFYVNGHDTGQRFNFLGEDEYFTRLDLSVTYSTGGGNSGGGGGGGGGGGLPPGDLWDCEEWSECIDGTQSQECTQGTATKTNTRDCEEVKPGTSGVATNTGAALDDEEGLEEPVLSGPGAPPEEQEEELGPTGAVAGPGIAASWIFLGVLIALIAALLLFIFLRKRKKS